MVPPPATDAGVERLVRRRRLELSAGCVEQPVASRAHVDLAGLAAAEDPPEEISEHALFMRCGGSIQTARATASTPPVLVESAVPASCRRPSPPSGQPTTTYVSPTRAAFDSAAIRPSTASPRPSELDGERARAVERGPDDSGRRGPVAGTHGAATIVARPRPAPAEAPSPSPGSRAGPHTKHSGNACSSNAAVPGAPRPPPRRTARAAAARVDRRGATLGHERVAVPHPTSPSIAPRRAAFERRGQAERRPRPRSADEPGDAARGVAAVPGARRPAEAPLDDDARHAILPAPVPMFSTRRQKPMRLALAQINTVVGDLDGNRDADPRAARARRATSGADLVLFPELAVTGYPPEDLLLRPGFLRAAEESLEGSRASAAGSPRSSAPPTSTATSTTPARPAPAARSGRVYRKRFLPNYGVFDEDALLRARPRPAASSEHRRRRSRADDLRGHLAAGAARDRPRPRRRPALDEHLRVAVPRRQAARARGDARHARARQRLLHRVLQRGRRPGRADLRRPLARDRRRGRGGRARARLRGGAARRRRRSGRRRSPDG